MRAAGAVPALADLALAVEHAEIRWRERPGLRAIEKLPVVAGPR